MLRWLGAALILCAAMLTRGTLLAAGRCAQRTRRALADAFEGMAAEIRALLTPLPALLRRTYGEAADGFFAAVSEELSCETPLGDAWRCASERLPLPPEERETIAALGARLNGGEDDVCAALTLTAAALRRSCDRAETQRREQERLISSLCLGAGAVVAILLL